MSIINKGVRSLDIPPRFLLIFFALGLQIVAHIVSELSPESWQHLFDLLGIILWLIWFAIVFMIAIPAMDRLIDRYWKQLKYAALGVGLILILTGIGEVVGIYLMNIGEVKIEVAETYSQNFGYNDGTALVHEASENLLDARNPYTETNLIETVDRFGVSLENLTPLQEGKFADSFPYPTLEEIDTAWQEAKANADISPAEFESKLTYPPGAFLFTATYLGLGFEDIRYFYLLCALLMFGIIIWQAPRKLWPLVILVAFASLEMWNDIAAGGTGSLYLLFLVAGWILLPRNLWLSAIFMGLAAISKQLAWFFIPFYFVLLFRKYGWQKTLQLGGVVGGIFLLANIPFIIGEPQLWADSVFAPLTDPMFPQGVGVITLSLLSGLIPEGLSMVYVLIEMGVYITCLCWYYYKCRKYPETGPLLAVFPLFFASRSYSIYFCTAAILVFAAVLVSQRRLEPHPAQTVLTEGEVVKN